MKHTPIRISKTRAQSGSKKSTTARVSVGGKKIAEARIRTR